MKHVFIINSQSAEKKRKWLTEEIHRLFPEDEAVIEVTDHPGHAKQLARQYASEGTMLRIYACGGDGTLHEVVNGVLGFSHVQVAVIPIGTGNDFIKAFPSYRSQDFLCLENYQDAKLAKSDVLMVDEEASINTVSAGLDVKVAYHVDKFKQLPFAHGVFPYFLGLLVSMAGSISEDLIVEIDGRREAFSDYLFVVAGNGRCYGGGYCPAPKARVDDGWFDYSLIRKVSRAKIITLSGKYKKGTHLAYKEFVRDGRAKTMRIWTGGKRIRLNLDGELYETSDPLITLAEQKIHLALPNPRSSASRSAEDLPTVERLTKVTDKKTEKQSCGR